MYEAIVRTNNSSRTPVKLELFFCPALAQDLDWNHEAQVIIRFEGTPERWAGTVGLRPRHDPYLWSNVVLVTGQSLGAEEGLGRPVSELLHLHGLSPRDRVPVHSEQNGDLILEVGHRRIEDHSEGTSRPAKNRATRHGRGHGSASSQSTTKVQRFPFGNKAAIEVLAEEYWGAITPSESDAERNQIPQIVDHARTRGYLKKDEFITLAGWKSKRPLRRYVTNDWRFIKTQTRDALASADRYQALKSLDSLDGVALRTATAILHWFRLADTPILDQRVVAAVGRTPPTSWERIDFYREVAEEILFEARRVDVDLRTMDRALWAWDKLNPR
jgi:hypothetical protein